MSRELTICVLLYGDHYNLHERILWSLEDRLNSHKVREPIGQIKIGMNRVCRRTMELLDLVYERLVPMGYKFVEYKTRKNAFKYPMMRRMFFDENHPLTPWVMWFDDDSYLDFTPGARWFAHLLERAEYHKVDMVGKIYYQAMKPKQWEWIQKQAWYNPQVGQPPANKLFKNRPAFRFATGGWWMARSSIFIKHDWPTPELKLCGGDSMLGELCRHQGYNLQNFDIGVKINADDYGNHSKAPGRGESPPTRERGAVMLGNCEPPKGLHDFECKVRVVDKVEVS